MSCDDDKECCKDKHNHNHDEECCKGNGKKNCKKDHGDNENCERKQRCCHGKRRQAMRLKLNNAYL